MGSDSSESSCAHVDVAARTQSTPWSSFTGAARAAMRVPTAASQSRTAMGEVSTVGGGRRPFSRWITNPIGSMAVERARRLIRPETIRPPPFERKARPPAAIRGTHRATMKHRPHAPRPARDGSRPAPRSEPRGPTKVAPAATEIVYGLRAGLAVLARRPDDIARVACARDAHPDVAEIARFASARRLPFEELPDADLARLAQSTHHEGLVVTARPRRWTPPADLADLLLHKQGVAVALDRVRNPYNIGAVLRSAAFFGVDAAILGAPAPHPALAPDAVRVAEGGAEHLVLTRTTDLADTLARLRTRGVRVVGADGASATRAQGYTFPRPTVLVLGHEREGMSDRVRAQCDAIISIPGSGAVESLNVAVAAGVLIAEMTRRR